MERFATAEEGLAALAARADDDVNFRGNFRAGALVRARVRAAIRSAEVDPDVEVRWNETKTLFESWFTFSLSGKASDVRDALITMYGFLPSEEG